MKKSRKPRTANKKARQAPEPDQARRRLLRHLRNAAIAIPVATVAGVFSVRSVQATICEGDLTKIGKGRPTIVQIHDPSCSLCIALQKQTRRALKPFDGDQFDYLVANINTIQGSTLAMRYGVPHVTLLLFDGQGTMVEVVRGPADANDLRPIFAAHLDQNS